MNQKCLKGKKRKWLWLPCEITFLFVARIRDVGKKKKKKKKGNSGCSWALSLNKSWSCDEIENRWLRWSNERNGKEMGKVKKQQIGYLNTESSWRDWIQDPLQLKSRWIWPNTGSKWSFFSSLQFLPTSEILSQNEIRSKKVRKNSRLFELAVLSSLSLFHSLSLLFYHFFSPLVNDWVMVVREAKDAGCSCCYVEPNYEPEGKDGGGWGKGRKKQVQMKRGKSVLKTIDEREQQKWLLQKTWIVGWCEQETKRKRETKESYREREIGESYRERESMRAAENTGRHNFFMETGNDPQTMLPFLSVWTFFYPSHSLHLSNQAPLSTSFRCNFLSFPKFFSLSPGPHVSFLTCCTFTLYSISLTWNFFLFQSLSSSCNDRGWPWRGVEEGFSKREREREVGWKRDKILGRRTKKRNGQRKGSKDFQVFVFHCAFVS